MELTVLNEQFYPIGIVDSFESLIWTERYLDCGDFEVRVPAFLDSAQYLLSGSYVECSDSNCVMFIEDFSIETDLEGGAHLTATGRSLESMLERRIVWKQTRLNGTFQNGVQQLLNENVIDPKKDNGQGELVSYAERKIDNFEFSPIAITDVNIDSQFTGDNLFEAIKTLCEVQGVGFTVTLSAAKKFVFQLYIPKDRSYDQSTNPVVVFSPEFENLLNSKYLYSEKLLKNITLVMGEDSGEARKKIEVITTETMPSGLDRRELYTDARDIQSEVDGEVQSDEEYYNRLRQRGLEKLSENTTSEEFEGETESHVTFKYGVDYTIGDIVEVANEYGISARARIIEYVRSEDSDGVKAYPTFATLQ